MQKIDNLRKTEQRHSPGAQKRKSAKLDFNMNRLGIQKFSAFATKDIKLKFFYSQGFERENLKLFTEGKRKI